MSVHLGTSGNEWRAGRLFGIPIYFSPWYLAFALFVLMRSGDVVDGLVWLGVLTLGVVVHELGHGLMAMRYRLGAKIVIGAFGGWCEHAPASRRQEDFHVVAAGPLAGLGLALVSWVLFELTSTVLPPRVASVFQMSAYANIFWSLFNVMPVYSMDGGRMLHVGLGWWTSNRRADGITWWTSAVVGSLLAMWGLTQGSLFIAFLCAYMAFQNFQRAQRHDPRQTFFPQRNPPRATPGGVGLDISSTLWRLAGATALLWLIGTVTNAFFGFAWALALEPSALAEGAELWRAITYAWVFAPSDWAPMLLAVLALLLCGPTVERRLGTHGLYGLLIAAALAGAVSATMLPELWPSLARTRVLGGGAVAMALVGAWGALSLEPVQIWRIRASPTTVALAIFLLDAGAVLSGLTTWNLALHVGGLVVGLVLAVGAGRGTSVSIYDVATPGQGGQFTDDGGDDVFH